MCFAPCFYMDVTVDFLMVYTKWEDGFSFYNRT